MTCILVSAALVPARVCGQEAAAQASAEVDALARQFGFSVTRLDPVPDNYTLNTDRSLTAASLPGAVFQRDAPQLGAVPPYPQEQQDEVASPPYLSAGLNNFRFSHFNNLFTFGGYHTWPTEDYAAVHGFDAIAEYDRDRTTGTWEPGGTRWMTTTTQLDWNSLMSALQLDAGRWDELVDVGEAAAIQAILAAQPFPQDPTRSDQLQIQLEIQPLAPAALRAVSWYPSSGTAADQAVFEKKYYDGFALTQYAAVDAARQLGFREISLYGWSPAAAGWFSLATYPADPAADWYWQKVGLQVISHVDSINNSVYCYYWDPDNVAYTLAQNDLNLAFINSLPPSKRKPLRPYFWNQLHADAGWRWWSYQPLPTEELRAMALLNAFTQFDGLVLWNWSGTGNDNLPPAVSTGADVMFADNSFAAPRQDGALRAFSRYEAVHITAADDSGNIQFQLLNLDFNNNYGVGAAFPVFTSTVTDLVPHLRAASEPLSGLFEGLALAKLLEWNLRHDSPVVDFDSQQVFASQLPVSRHVKNGDLHILATYDPQVVYGRPARNITINDFNGVSGLSLTLAADSQVRLYAVRMSAGLLGRWPFDENSGFVTADGSGHGNSGTLVNGPVWTAGQSGGALSFNGASSLVTINAPANVGNLYKSGMTVTAWIQPNDAGGMAEGRIVDKDNRAKGWYLAMAGNNTIRFTSRQAQSGTPSRVSTAGIVTNTWQHVAATWDGGASGQNIHIYINGVPADGESCDGQLPNSSDLQIPLTIGNRPVDGSRGFNGAIDDVRIYNGVLTPAQIQAIANGS